MKLSAIALEVKSLSGGLGVIQWVGGVATTSLGSSNKVSGSLKLVPPNRGKYSKPKALLSRNT